MLKKIYYHDTDAGGVVYYANYLKYMEEARTEFLDSIGLGVKEFMIKGIFYAVRSCDINYKSPARYGDTIQCDASVLEVTGAQIVFRQTVRRQEDQRLLVEARVALACLDHDFKPQPLPDELRTRLA